MLTLFTLFALFTLFTLFVLFTLSRLFTLLPPPTLFTLSKMLGHWSGWVTWHPLDCSDYQSTSGTKNINHYVRAYNVGTYFCSLSHLHFNQLTTIWNWRHLDLIEMMTLTVSSNSKSIYKKNVSLTSWRTAVSDPEFACVLRVCGTGSDLKNSEKVRNIELFDHMTAQFFFFKTLPKAKMT